LPAHWRIAARSRLNPECEGESFSLSTTRYWGEEKKTASPSFPDQKERAFNVWENKYAEKMAEGPGVLPGPS
jgi:hypothetical protein